jgi:hypothetical protein
VTPDRRPPVDVLVLTYNDREAAVDCLESVLRSEGASIRVTVVDNASEDDTVPEIRRRFSECNVVVNEQNLGFAGGCNRGLELALEQGAEFVLILNQDTRVAPDLVARLKSFMLDLPAAAVAGARTRSFRPMPDGSPRLIYAGAWRRRLPLRQRIPGIEESDRGVPDLPVRTDYVWGHGMFLRCSALREVGLFDPAFFMYYEDLDLCRRMEEAGHEIWCEPRALMWHDTPDGARAIESERWRWEQKIRSSDIFHAKYHGRAAKLMTALTVLGEAYELIRTGRIGAARDLTRAWAAALLRPAGPGPAGGARPPDPLGRG